MGKPSILSLKIMNKTLDVHIEYNVLLYDLLPIFGSSFKVFLN